MKTCNKMMKLNAYGYGKHKLCGKPAVKVLKNGERETCRCPKHYKEFRKRVGKNNNDYKKNLKVVNPKKLDSNKKRANELKRIKYAKDPVYQKKMKQRAKAWALKNPEKLTIQQSNKRLKWKKEGVARALDYYNKNKNTVKNPLINTILDRYYKSPDHVILWEQQFKLCVQQILFVLGKMHFCEYPISFQGSKYYVDIYIPASQWIEVKAPYHKTTAQKMKNQQIKELKVINKAQPDLELDLKKLHNLKGKEKVVAITADNFDNDGIYEWLKLMGVK